MDEDPPNGLLRDLLALVIVALACPIAVRGGAMLGCMGQPNWETTCAMQFVFIGPPLLGLAGVIAGVASRGWTGGMIVILGTSGGMLMVLVLSMLLGMPLAIDWFSAIAATIWFVIPTTAGYGAARLVHRVRGRIVRRDVPEGSMRRADH